MSRKSLLFLFFTFSMFCANAQQTNSSYEAGEDFDLEAVMSVMEDAEDLADLEKKINDPDMQVNNLDLNSDDEVDIVKIVEYDEDNTRLLVIQAVLGENDFQDVATIEIEKHGEDSISLQIVGDPDLYGPDYVLEPAGNDSSSGNNQGGGDAIYLVPEHIRELSAAVFFSVHRWRPIRPLFRVGRVIFISNVVWRPLAPWFIVRRPIARATWRNRAIKYNRNRYRTATKRHSRNASRMYSNKRKRSAKASREIKRTTTTKKVSPPKKATPSKKATGPKKGAPVKKPAGPEKVGVKN